MRTLRYIGLADVSGYAVAATRLVRALHSCGVDVVYEPMVPGIGLQLGYELDSTGRAGPDDLRQLREDGTPCRTAIFHLVPEYYPFFIERERKNGAEILVGHTVWETDRLPAHWPNLLNQLDAVIVPTDWNRDVFRNSGVRIPIIVTPHLPESPVLPSTQVDLDSIECRLRGLEGRRLFYTIATWLERKGIEPLIEAFTSAFSQKDAVALIVKTTPFDLERVRTARRGQPAQPLPVKPQFDAMVRRASWRRLRRAPPIVLVTDNLTDGELRALHERCDCFVSLCRAEGWGLGGFEAATRGKPVMMTGWGGPLAFLAPETAFLVDHDRVSVKPGCPNASYTPDQNWVEPRHSSAVSALRQVFLDPPEAERRASLARDDILTRFCGVAVVSDLLMHLARI